MKGIRVTFVLLLSFFATEVFAQTAGGTILGKVTDQSGAVLPGAEITIKNVATGVTRAMLSNESGLYSAANLQPGTYEVKVELPSFAVEVRKDINLNVGSELVIDLALHVAGSTETVDVKAENTNVDLVASTVSRTVEGTTIRELPLNGRDWAQLATLEPGIANIGNGGAGGRDGDGYKMTVSGARPSENNFRLDGVSLIDSSNSTPGNVLGTNLGVEAVREFSVVSNSYSAEYGRATGAVVNAVTKSGGNDVRGSLFYFHRNSALDARNFFDGSVKPDFRRHQFGASVGGPIAKNRTFWFGNFEEVREFLSTTSISDVLSANARQGLLSTGAVTVDPNIARLFGLMPLPNGPPLGAGDIGIFSTAIDKISNGKYILGKMDHNLSAAHSLSSTYFYDDASSNSPDALLTKKTANTSRRQMVALEDTRTISPQLLNVARFGFYRTANVSGTITSVLNPLLEDTSLGFVPGQNIGATSVPGISVPGNGPGASNNVTQLFWDSFQGSENLFITSGRHALKVGASFERMRYNMDIPNLNGGSFTFGSLAGFLTNKPTNFGANFPGSFTRRGLRQTMIAGYLQDDFRFKTNLSFNLGVRYEFLTIPTEVNGKVALLKNLTDPAPTVGGPILYRNPTVRNFSPRVGFVWDPFKSGKTSIRSSFGIFDSLPLLWLMDTPLARSLPYFLQGVTTAPAVGSYPNGAFSALQVTNFRTAYIEPEPPRAYSMRWNLNIQRDIFGWLADIGYTGSRGVHLPLVERNMDSVIPVKQDGVWIYPAGKPKLNPNFGSINTSDTWNADSYYQGLQVSIKRDWRSGVHFQSSYAWSKSIDTASSTGSTSSGSGYTGAMGVATPLLPILNRGLSDFDMRHNFNFNMVWELPFAKHASGIASLMAKGWQLGSILRAQSGLPFSVEINNDRAGSLTDTTGSALGQRPNRITGGGCDTLTNAGNPHNYVKTQCFLFPAKGTLGNLGRNTLTKPGISTLDFSLVRNFKMAETRIAQLRIEMFNALNHTNFGTPSTVVFDGSGNVPSSAGTIISTSTTSRQIQAGLKINF
jgi:hypothetical protein